MSVSSKLPTLSLTPKVIQSTLDFDLGHEQKKALGELKAFWNSKEAEFYLLKGFAGTGKSTLCSVFLNELPQERVCLCASTNKAARVLEDKCRALDLKVKTSTVHKLLKLVPQQIGDQWKLRQVGEPQLKGFDLIVIDECSMLGEDVWNFIQDLPFDFGLKVLCMGDPAQLPPVNERQSPSFDIPFYSELSEIFRQGKGHPILNYSLEIRCALQSQDLKVPLPKSSEGIQLFRSHSAWLTDLKKTYLQAGVKESLDAVQVLTWTNHRVEKWNAWIQKNVYTSEHGPFMAQQALILTSPLVKGGWQSPLEVVMPNNELVFAIASKGIEWRGLNLWELTIRSIDGKVAEMVYVAPEQKEAFEVQMSLWQEELSYKINALAQIEKWRRQCVGLQAASAITTHRSQGSSYEVVYLDLPSILSCPSAEEKLQMLYVAVTRAKKELKVLMPT